MMTRRGETIVLKGKMLKDTTFENCTFLYRGDEFGGFSGCVFRPFNVVFEGAAANTMQFLQALYKGGAEGFVQELFRMVAEGREGGRGN